MKKFLTISIIIVAALFMVACFSKTSTESVPIFYGSIGGGVGAPIF